MKIIFDRTLIGSQQRVTTSSGHSKKEFGVNDLAANFIEAPIPFMSQASVANECKSWKKEGDSYKSIVTELGRILLSEDPALDADLTDLEVPPVRTISIWY